MTSHETIEALKREANRSPAANAVFHVFADRQRARQSINTAALVVRMEREKFDFPVKQYEDVLKFLSTLGLGTIVLNNKGRVKGLTNIKVTLQSIGMAALSESRAQRFEGFRAKPKFQKLPTEKPVEAPAAPAPKPLGKATGAVAGFPVSVTVVVNGKPVNFRIPNELSEAEIADLVVRFRDKGVSR